MNLHNYSSTMKREPKAEKPKKERNIDFKKHVHLFVLGCVYEYFKNMGMQADIGTPRFDFYVNHTVNITIGYLEGTRQLDGGCSDLQCSIGHQAAGIWGWPDR